MEGTYEIRLEGLELIDKELLEFKDNNKVTWSLGHTFITGRYTEQGNSIKVSIKGKEGMIVECWTKNTKGVHTSDLFEERYLKKLNK